MPSMKKNWKEIEAAQNKRSQESRLPLYGILENIRSLYNVGSMFRTADGAGFSGIYLTGFTGAPPDKRIEKTALGSTESVEWQRFDSTAECIKNLAESREPRAKRGTVEKPSPFLIALEHSHKSIPYTEIRLPPNRPTVLVVGNEITGIEDETLKLCDIHTEIPMMGKKHSLNVSVAFGILAFHLAMLLKRATSDERRAISS